MHKLRLSLRAGILLGLFSQAVGALSADAQDQASPALAQTVPAHDLAQLKQHRENWPAHLILKNPIKMSIVSNGKEAGSFTSPQGATVDLIAVNGTTLEIGVMNARATVSPEDTDLWQRIVPPAQNTPATPAPAMAATSPSAPSTVPSPPPSLPPPSSSPPANAPTAVAGKPLLFDYEVSARDNFTKADYRFWSPSYDQPARGVIVLTPGFNGDGRGMVNDGAWQALARKYRLALVACSLQGGNYYEAKRGTGDALQEALKNFAKQAAHDEIARVPLLLYGESAGGQFDYDYVLWKPERVMAFIVNKGGYYDGATPESKTYSVPGLFFLGQKDQDFRIKAITTIWTEGRGRGALWALAPQPNSGHEFSKTAAVARTFFEAVLKSRLPDETASADDPSPMKPMQENQGWIGDLTTHEIHDGSTDGTVNNKASWLPDQSTATAWKAFVQG